jgi:hypothetical protein
MATMCSARWTGAGAARPAAAVKAPAERCHQRGTPIQWAPTDAPPRSTRRFFHGLTRAHPLRLVARSGAAR